MSVQEQSVPTWDMSISHPLAFLKQEPAVVDFCFALFTPIAFAARFGVAPQPLLPPGEAIGGTALQIANWNRRTRLYEEQQKHLISLRRLIIATPQLRRSSTRFPTLTAPYSTRYKGILVSDANC